MLETVAMTLVACLAMYFIAFGAAALFVPKRAGAFLLAFARTPVAHFSELLLRCTAGAALVSAAPRLAYGDVIMWFGWLLLGTSTLMLLIPWRLHRDFAARNVPKALPYLVLIGLCSMALGVALLTALLVGR